MSETLGASLWEALGPPPTGGPLPLAASREWRALRAQFRASLPPGHTRCPRSPTALWAVRPALLPHAPSSAARFRRRWAARSARAAGRLRSWAQRSGSCLAFRAHRAAR